jgi:hypothetical protein
MYCRLPLLLAFLLSLAFGPVQWSAACALPAVPVSCGNCCTAAEMACCVSTDRSFPATPDSVAPQTVDGKLLVSPYFVFAGLSPAPVVERSSFHKRLAARLPAPPRLDLTCIRLI